MTLTIDQTAPDFSLYDSDKNKVTLSDFRDKKNVLLLFFPLAYTSVCTAELCGVRDDIGRYSNSRAEVMGISVDSVYTLAKYKEEENYNFPLLSDFNKQVSAMYGALYDSFSNMDMKGVGKRAAFVIDKKGIIVERNAKQPSDRDSLYAQLDKYLTEN